MERIRYEEGLKNLQSMFPDLETDLIKSVIESCENNYDITINCLLEISSNMREQESNLYKNYDNKFTDNIEIDKMQKSKDISINKNTKDKEKGTKSNIVSIFGNSQQSKIETELNLKNNVKDENKNTNKEKNKVIEIDKSKKADNNIGKSNMVEVEIKKNSGSIGSKMKNWVTNLFSSKKKDDANKKTSKNDDGYKKLSMDDN